MDRDKLLAEAARLESAAASIVVPEPISTEAEKSAVVEAIRERNRLLDAVELAVANAEAALAEARLHQTARARDIALARERRDNLMQQAAAKRAAAEEVTK